MDGERENERNGREEGMKGGDGKERGDQRKETNRRKRGEWKAKRGMEGKQGNGKWRGMENLGEWME